MTELRHRLVEANGVRLHLAECGSGPTVLMIHGFPESWYSWRYQLPALAAAGYHAVALDVRGYGRSSKPISVDAYRMVRNVGDIVALCDALSDEPVTVVGHDWGAPIAWTSALLRPDRFRGVAGLSVPYSAPARADALPPTARMAAMVGSDEEFYVQYFQEPGRAEAEIEQNVREWLLGFYWCASGDVVDGPDISRVPKGTRLRDKFVYPAAMPDWLSEEDLDRYATEFEYSGFFGPLCRYRNVDRDYEDLAPFAGRPIEIPALFVGGERDGPTIWGAPAIAAFGEALPKLHRSEIIPGAGHWIQQEAAERCNELLLDFLGALH